MNKKQSAQKNRIDWIGLNSSSKSVVNSKNKIIFFPVEVPRKTPVVPQNFWTDSPLGFWGKIILLAMSLFFGLAIMAIFMGEILNILLK